MQESEDTKPVTHNLSFESLKQLNEHGIEYWGARELQPCLGYTEWRKFEKTIKKAISSCKQSGNEPDKHFVGADKMIGIRTIIEEIGGTLPENIPPDEPIKKVKKRLKDTNPLLTLDTKETAGI